MNIRLHITDNMTENLRARLAKVGDKTPLAMAAAATLKTWAEQAFDDPGKRPSPWAPRKGGGSHPLLKKHGLLWRSFRVEPGNGSATLVTDRPYAAAHQFGSRAYVIRPKNGKALSWPGAKHPVKQVNHPGLPARPFFPFNAAGELMPAAAERVLATIRRRVAALLGGQ